MSCVVVVTPIVIASWPMISAAITAAVASTGFTMIAGAGRAAGLSARPRADTEAEVGGRVEMEIDDSEILADNASGAAGGSERRIVVERDGVRAVFSRDARGQLKLCMEGEHLSKKQLREIGDELIGRVTQQYAYHRIVSELKGRGMTLVDATITADRSIKLRLRTN